MFSLACSLARHDGPLLFPLNSLPVVPGAMGNDKEDEDPKFWEKWAAEEAQKWETHEKVNEHIKQRKAALQKKAKEDHGSNVYCSLFKNP